MLVLVHSERADMVLDQHETSVTMGEEVRGKIRNALLKQHHHQNQKKLANRIPIVRSFADIGKKQSEPHSMDKNGKFYTTFNKHDLIVMQILPEEKQRDTCAIKKEK